MSKNAAVGMFAAVLLATPGLAFAADTIKGTIVSRTDQSIVIRANGADTTVQINDATKVRGTTGALNVRGDDYKPSDLIRGLSVEITPSTVATTDLTAAEVTFKKSDLRTAQQINAGLATTDQNVATTAAGVQANAAGIARNSERIDDVGQLVAKDRTSVYFATGSSTLTAKGRQDLMAIADQAKATKGSRLAVVGRADTTGNAAANQRLSEQRAAAVTSFLMTSGGISPAVLLPEAALGSSTIAEDPNPPKNDAEARRVTVTVAVSKSSQE